MIKKILIYLLVASRCFAMPVNKSMSAIPSDVKAQIINTQGNNVGIAENDICVAVEFDATKTIIVCKSGKIFSSVDQRLSAITGTPGHLMYRNYIGTFIISPSTGIPGSGKRIDYCIHPCTKK